MSTTRGAETMFGASRVESGLSVGSQPSSAQFAGESPPSGITSTPTLSTTTPGTSPSSAAPATWPPTGPEPYYSDALVASPVAGLVREDWDDGAVTWIGSTPVIAFWPAARTSLLLNAANAAGLTKHRASTGRSPTRSRRSEAGPAGRSSPYGCCPETGSCCSEIRTSTESRPSGSIETLRPSGTPIRSPRASCAG